MKRLLLHVCCASCLAGLFERLRGMDVKATGYFYNPNIHPLLEFRRRMKAIKVLQESENFPIVYDERYGLKEFLKKVDFEKQDRCCGCYTLRLTRTAEYARDNGYDSFTSTLLISHQQDNEILRSVGEKIEAESGLQFYYEDFRQLQPKGLEIAKRRSLYRQQYCGCIFSECERFINTSKFLYEGKSR